MLYFVYNVDADLQYIVDASSRKLAKEKILRFLRHSVSTANRKKLLPSVQRMYNVANKKKCGVHVLLKTTECPEAYPGIYSLIE